MPFFSQFWSSQIQFFQSQEVQYLSYTLIALVLILIPHPDASFERIITIGEVFKLLFSALVWDNSFYMLLDSALLQVWKFQVVYPFVVLKD